MARTADRRAKRPRAGHSSVAEMSLSVGPDAPAQRRLVASVWFAPSSAAARRVRPVPAEASRAPRALAPAFRRELVVESRGSVTDSEAQDLLAAPRPAPAAAPRQCCPARPIRRRNCPTEDGDLASNNLARTRLPKKQATHTTPPCLEDQAAIIFVGMKLLPKLHYRAKTGSVNRYSPLLPRCRRDRMPSRRINPVKRCQIRR